MNLKRHLKFKWKFSNCKISSHKIKANRKKIDPECHKNPIISKYSNEDVCETLFLKISLINSTIRCSSIKLKILKVKWCPLSFLFIKLLLKKDASFFDVFVIFCLSIISRINKLTIYFWDFGTATKRKLLTSLFCLYCDFKLHFLYIF